MENLYDQNVIEQYLEGTLPAVEREAVEARAASDPVFRARLELHRQLQEEFEDAEKTQLRFKMANIVRETPTPKDSARPKPYKLLVVIGLLLLAIWGIWQLSRTFFETLPTVPTQQDSSPLPPPQKSSDSIPKPPAKSPSEPIAMVNRAAFKPNPAFEQQLGNGGIRSGQGEEVRMKNPVLGADYKAVKGRVKIQFNGTVASDGDTAEHPLRVKVFASQSADKPVAQFEPNIQNRTAQYWDFSIVQSLRLDDGLYYYFLERQADEQLVFVGKFTVGAKE